MSDLEQIAIERLKAASEMSLQHYGLPLVITDSGGKDSSVCKERRIILNNDNDDKRMLFENCRLKAKRVVNPIVDWTDDDVWQFLTDAKAPVNPLYAEGWCRVGCVGCPMAGQDGRIEQFKRWPKYKNLYLLAFKNLLDERAARGMYTSWQTPEDVYNWWMEYDTIPGQMDIFDFIEEDDG